MCVCTILSKIGGGGLLIEKELKSEIPFARSFSYNFELYFTNIKNVFPIMLLNFRSISSVFNMDVKYPIKISRILLIHYNIEPQAIVRAIP